MGREEETVGEIRVGEKRPGMVAVAVVCSDICGVCGGLWGMWSLCGDVNCVLRVYLLL